MARILIIDDNPADCELLVTFLGYYGHVLFEARDGVEGLELALLERPDLIITDIQMPMMDGYELARRVRADPQLSSTRLVFYTSSLSTKVRQAAVDNEVARILTKPAEPEIILATVNAAVGGTPAIAHPAPDFEQDPVYLRLLNSFLRRNVEELNAEIRAHEQAEAAARRQAERAHLLATISRALATATDDYPAILDMIARQLATTIGDGCCIRLASADGARDELAALHHPDSEIASFIGYSVRGGLLGN